MRVADYIIKFLADKGVDTVFAVSGGGCIYLIDALYNNKNITTIATHHEQSAAFAAEGYARLKNDVGVCIVTSGPGGTNAITGVLCAWQDSVPLIFISGQVNCDLTTEYTELPLRQLGDQEYNIVSAVKNMTKFSAQINDPERIEYYLNRAYHTAIGGRPGPVWLDIPLDVQNAQMPEQLEARECHNQRYPSTIRPMGCDIDIIVDKLSKSTKPLLIIGNGVRLANAESELMEFLNKTKIPVITSLNGNDLVTKEYEHYSGRFGIIAQIGANQLIQECDLLLSIGSRLYIRQIGYSHNTFAKNAYKIYSDIDIDELTKPTLRPDLIVHSDAKHLLTELNNAVIDLPDYSEWHKNCKSKQVPSVIKKHRHQTPRMSFYRFLEVFNGFMKRDMHIVCSNGATNVMVSQVLQNVPGQRIIINKGCAPMGYGLPAAIGAYYVNKQPIVCFEGDGSIQMNIQELQTVSHHKLPIKIFIVNNDGYLSIKVTQNGLCGGRKMISDPSSGITFPDHRKIAYAYDIDYIRADNEALLPETIKQVMDHEGPVICEIFTNPNEVYEPKVNIQGISTNGKMIPGEIGNIKWVT